MTTIVKRNGKTVEFDKSKIRVAIQKAMKNGSGVYLPDIARLIANDAEKFFAKKSDSRLYFFQFYFFCTLFTNSFPLKKELKLFKVTSAILESAVVVRNA